MVHWRIWFGVAAFWSSEIERFNRYTRLRSIQKQNSNADNRGNAKTNTCTLHKASIVVTLDNFSCRSPARWIPGNKAF